MAKHILEQGRSIKEACDVYGLSVDKLYYCEKLGLINPSRDPGNGYRIYGAREFQRLNVIVELREMGFSFGQIKEYLDEQTFSSTMMVMDEELRQIDAQMSFLNDKKSSIVGSMQRYALATTAAQQEEVTITHIPQRPCLVIAQDEIYYQDLPYATAKCAQKHGIRLRALHSNSLYVVDPDEPLRETGVFSPAVMLLKVDPLPCEPDYVIEAGLYATCVFKGSLLRGPEIYEKIVRYVRENGYEVAGLPIESSPISEYETSKLDEFISCVEVPVRQAAAIAMPTASCSDGVD